MDINKQRNSILTSIKKLLGPDEECTDFDIDIIIHINTVLMILTQMGVGPSNGFFISDKESTWNDFISLPENKLAYLEAVKSYVYLKVKLLFDPPNNATVIESIRNNIRELEWRINSAVEEGGYE